MNFAKVRLVCRLHAAVYEVCDCPCTCTWQELAFAGGHHDKECPEWFPGALRAMVPSRPPGDPSLLNGRLWVEEDAVGDVNIWVEPGAGPFGPDSIARQCDVTPAAWQLLLEAVERRTPGINVASP